MNSQERQAIEAKIGRALTADEIGRGSINRAAPAQTMTWEQKKAARRAAIKAINTPELQEQFREQSARWIETTKEYDGPKKRETPKQFRKRMAESREQRAAEAKEAAESTAKLATDPTYLRMNEVAAKTVERLRWDDSYPQAAWDRALLMQQAAKANDRQAFQALNKGHVEFLESVTNEKQSAIDAKIAQLQQERQSVSADRYAEPLPAPSKESYSHIKRASGMMQFVNKTDGHIEEYDPRVPGARQSAEQKLAQHQSETAGKYGESIPVQV